MPRLIANEPTRRPSENARVRAAECLAGRELTPDEIAALRTRAAEGADRVDDMNDDDAGPADEADEAEAPALVITVSGGDLTAPERQALTTLLEATANAFLTALDDAGDP